jgi:LAO/AO transport system kinase
MKTTALSGQGISEIADAIAAHQAYLVEHNLRTKKESARFDDTLRELVKSELLQKTLEQLSPTRWQALVDEITSRKRDLYSVADEIVQSTT